MNTEIKPFRPTPEIKHRARELRQIMTRAERLLWKRLHNRQLRDLKFRRQHPIGPFIVDFYCASHRLIIEIDGDIHDHQVAYDLERTDLLKDCGYQVIRFHNAQVPSDIEPVLDEIVIVSVAIQKH